MAAIGRLFARSTKAAEETVPLVSREAEREANAAASISHAFESTAGALKSVARSNNAGRSAVNYAKAGAIVAGAGVGVWASVTAVNAARGLPQKIEEGAQAVGEGLLHMAEEAVHLPAEIAQGVTGLTSGHTMELVAVTVVALGAGFVLVHYATNLI
jgi:hypothetical protein